MLTRVLFALFGGVALESVLRLVAIFTVGSALLSSCGAKSKDTTETVISHRHHRESKARRSTQAQLQQSQHDLSDSNCPNYDTTSLEDKATGELSNDDYVDSMGDFASSAKFRIECMKSTSGFSHYKQESYAAVDSYGVAMALKLGNIGADQRQEMVVGSKMLAKDVLAHGNVPSSVATQMEKIANDFQGVGN